MRQRSIGTRPYFNTGAALRLIDLVQDAVQLLLGQDVKIHQRIQLDSHHHGYRGSTILLFSGRASCVALTATSIAVEHGRFHPQR